MTDTVTITSTACDGLLFRSLSADEELGELFRFAVQFESANGSIDLTGLLGSSMTVTLALQDGFRRYFNGIVCEASQTATATVDSLVYAQYSVLLVPKPWLLGQTVDCRIFTNMSAPDIITQLLSEAGYTDVQNNLSSAYTTRDYCVQYREDGLSFIHRLMEQEGIYYFFTHANGTHTMVLADGVGAHSVGATFKTVPYAPRVEGALRTDAAVNTFEALRGVDSATVKLTDYNPLTPKASLDVSDTSDGHGPSVAYAEFDYPGTHGVANDGQHYATVRAEALTAARSFGTGTTTACGVCAGNLFTLDRHPQGALNQEYLLTETQIYLRSGGRASGAGNELEFQGRFHALPSSVPFRKTLKTRKPKIVGLQTAIVTGSETDEDIAIDEYGRVQVNFHWNMPNRPHAQCSCPVRVASMWAGKNWGAVSYPRVGQEVVVSFIEGDPDRPLIIGSVYNAANVTPYALPANKTQSGIKSRSLLGGTDDFNELRLEDKKGQEDFFIHAQKDMHEEVEHDHTVTIDHDEILTVKNDRTHTIDNNDTLTVKGDRSHTVDKTDTLSVTKSGSTTIGTTYSLSAGDKIELTCGASSITMKASGEITISGSSISISGTQSVSIAGQMGVSISGLNISAEADAEATLKGTMTTVQGEASTMVKGAIVTVAGQGMTQISGGIVMLG
ncbi:MAG TPA: type VI secretion system tip protein TssI/VgrG [Rhodanobacteraceae bacterium]